MTNHVHITEIFTEVVVSKRIVDQMIIDMVCGAKDILFNLVSTNEYDYLAKGTEHFVYGPILEDMYVFYLPTNDADTVDDAVNEYHAMKEATIEMEQEITDLVVRIGRLTMMDNIDQDILDEAVEAGNMELARLASNAIAERSKTLAALQKELSVLNQGR